MLSISLYSKLNTKIMSYYAIQAEGDYLLINLHIFYLSLMYCPKLHVKKSEYNDREYIIN